MLIQFSPKSTPYGSSASTAWPMWAPKLRTPGIARSSILAAVVIRTSSGWEVPGAVTQCIRKSRSLKSGSSDCPSLGTTATPSSTMTATAASAGRGPRMIRARAAVYPRWSHRTSGDWRRSSDARCSRIRLSAGVTVRATSMDASTASA